MFTYFKNEEHCSWQLQDQKTKRESMAENYQAQLLAKKPHKVEKYKKWIQPVHKI